MSHGHDPFAAIAEPSESEDPFASIAEPAVSHGAGGSWELAPLRERLTRIEKPDPNAPIGKQVVNTLGNIGAGLMTPLLHPVDTLAGIGGIITAPFEAMDNAFTGSKRTTVPQDIVKSFRENPQGFIEGAVGQSAFGEGVGELAPRVPRAIRSGAESAAKGLADTGPAPVKALVEKTEKVNERVAGINAKRAQAYREAVASTDAENARLAKEHEQGVQIVDAENAAKRDRYHKEVTTVSEENTKKVAEHEAAKTRVDNLEKAAKEQNTYRSGLARQIKEHSSRLLNRIRQSQEKAKATVDARFQALREKMQGSSVPAEDLSGLVQKAEGKLAGSSENIKIFRDIINKSEEAGNEYVFSGGAKFGPGTPVYDSVKASQQGLPVNAPRAVPYSDLQGYYSELGSKLSSGSLPGDVYQALKSLQEDIGGAMQKLAASRGQGAALSAARAMYRDYMQTFREQSGPSHSGSPIAQALAAKDPAYAIDPLLKDESAARVRSALVRFDKDVHGAASLYDNLRGESRMFDNLKDVKVPKAPAPPKLEELPAYPGLKPRPEPNLKPAPKLPNEIPSKTISEGDVVKAKEKSLEKRASGVKRHLFWWAAVWPAFEMLKGQVPSAGGVLAGAGANVGITTLLRNPSVVDFLTRATESDVAQIPPELRGKFPSIVKDAQTNGVSVSPALRKAFVGAIALAPRQNDTDAWQQNP